MVAIEAMGMNEIFHGEEIIQEAKSGKFSKHQDMWISKMTQSLKEQCPERKEDTNGVAAEETVS